LPLVENANAIPPLLNLTRIEMIDGLFGNPQKKYLIQRNFFIASQLFPFLALFLAIIHFFFWMLLMEKYFVWLPPRH